MCENQTSLEENSFEEDFIKSAIEKLKQLEEDGLLKMEGKQIVVTNRGKSFIRNISAAIDAQLWRKQITGNTFSKAI
jgi:oxygen-independent coproporphyrinogen-3 oxidase